MMRLVLAFTVGYVLGRVVRGATPEPVELPIADRYVDALGKWRAYEVMTPLRTVTLRPDSNTTYIPGSTLS